MTARELSLGGPQFIYKSPSTQEVKESSQRCRVGSNVLADSPRRNGRTAKVNGLSERFGWNYTTTLNVVFLLVLAGIYWLHRSKERFGGGQDYARDPVCGMQVEKQNAGAVLRAYGRTTYFCSDHCKERYQRRDLAAARS